jgi:hypothetical protein
MAITPNKKGPACSIPVVCIDDSGKPSDIPAAKWPVKGRRYTVTSFVVMVNMGMIIGVTLEEINLSGCYPYIYYRENRFAVSVDDSAVLARAEELLKEAMEEALAEQSVELDMS